MNFDTTFFYLIDIEKFIVQNHPRYLYGNTLLK